MSAPASTTPAPPRGRLNPPRLLGAVAFAALGFVAVWQGFGLAGFGTDAHALRILAACAPLFVCGLVLVWPRMKLPVRVVAVLLGLGAAGAAWWFVPCQSGISLQDAVEWRAESRDRLAKPLLDQPRNGYLVDEDLKVLERDFPSLILGLRDEYTRWVATAEESLAEGYQRVAPDDLATAVNLNAQVSAVNQPRPRTGERVDTARRQWLTNAMSARTEELRKLELGDWAEFDRTAPKRAALADAFPDTRDALIRTEAEWVDSATELAVSRNLTPKPGEPPTRPAFWVQLNTDIMGLKSLDPSERRFAKSRERLFVVAHSATQQAITARLDAREYDVAYGIARKHAVDWNPTAKILGDAEVKKLDALCATCEGLAAFAAKAAPPADAIDIAPPPRTKP